MVVAQVGKLIQSTHLKKLFFSPTISLLNPRFNLQNLGDDTRSSDPDRKGFVAVGQIAKSNI